MPRVSVVIPVCNVEKYLRECIDSALNQTLKEIEVICVDDGSTDGSPAILDEYAAKDPRVRVIHKPNAGYGQTMNVGIDAATGEYIAILESDDYIKPDMYEVLYRTAEKYRLDLVKSDHEVFVGEPGNRTFTYMPIGRNKQQYGRVINPAEELDAFNARMQTWSGLYRKSFLEQNHIRHNETSGASYQDNGFWFLSFLYAKRIAFVNRAFYCLRRDNPNSSVHSKGKVFCIFEEYAYIENRLRSESERAEKFIGIFHKKKVDNCLYHYGRVSKEFKLEYLKRLRAEFCVARDAGELNADLFYGYGYQTLCEIMDQPELFYARTALREEERTPEQEVMVLRWQLKRQRQDMQNEIDSLKNSISYRVGLIVTFLPRKLRGGIRCLQENGLAYTGRRLLEKFPGSHIRRKGG